MTKQFPAVSCRYGAPMGRHSSPSLDLTPRSVRLFRVRLDAGGYDDGGAYWGHSRSGSVWCAMDKDGDIQTCRATSRNHAAAILDIPPHALRVPLNNWREWAQRVLENGSACDEVKDAVSHWLTLN